MGSAFPGLAREQQLRAYSLDPQGMPLLKAAAAAVPVSHHAGQGHTPLSAFRLSPAWERFPAIDPLVNVYPLVSLLHTFE